MIPGVLVTLWNHSIFLFRLSVTMVYPPVGRDFTKVIPPGIYQANSPRFLPR